MAKSGSPILNVPFVTKQFLQLFHYQSFVFGPKFVVGIIGIIIVFIFTFFSIWIFTFKELLDYLFIFAPYAGYFYSLRKGEEFSPPLAPQKFFANMKKILSDALLSWQSFIY